METRHKDCALCLRARLLVLSLEVITFCWCKDNCFLQLDYVRTVGISFSGPFSIVPSNNRVAFFEDVLCQLHTCIGSWSPEQFLASKNEYCLYLQERIVPILQVERPRPIPTQQVFIMCPLLFVNLIECLFCISHSTRLWAYTNK